MKLFVLEFELLIVYNNENGVYVLKILLMNKLNVEKLFCNVVFLNDYVIINN